MGYEINITVTKTELLKKPLNKSNVLNESAFKLLSELKLELIKLFGGLSESQTFIGYWVNSEGVTEEDLNVNWTILGTEEGLTPVQYKRLNEICMAIKLVTKQKSQLVTIKKNVNVVFITETF